MKLLAKTAEERYQTAAGVESDLRRCLDEWETRGWIDEFPLGEHDTPDRLLIPEKLYGRASEIETLLAAFDRIVAGGRPELVLVSGYSGIGTHGPSGCLGRHADSALRFLRQAVCHDEVSVSVLFRGMRVKAPETQGHIQELEI